MSEAAALVLMQTLMTLFPPLAQLIMRLLPDDDAEPLVGKIRAILPVEGASTGVRKRLEAAEFASADLDEDDV